MNSYQERILEFIESERLIRAGERILLGYSGGADSTCLLHALVSLGFDCTAAYLHHGQRLEADGELARCRSFAERLGVPFVSALANVPLMSSELGIGIEEAGRKARYAFFEQAAFETGCDLVATAHTLDDHFETVILNLARGSAMSGLKGIPIKRGEVIRPLLCLSRQETHDYCAEAGFTIVSDPANEDIQFSRARVRHRIVPELKLINPSATHAVYRMSRLVAEEDDFLNGMAAAALEQSETVRNPDLAFLTRDCELILSRSKITSLPAVLFKRAMILATKALGSSLDSKHVLKLLDGVTETEKGSLTAPDGLVSIVWNAQTLTLRKREELLPYRENFDFPGSVESSILGWKLTATLSQGHPHTIDRKALEASLLLRNLRRPLSFRSLLPGDKMQPIGFEGHRKLSDLMSEAGLSEMARNRLPVVCDMAGPLWVPGVCLDSRATNLQILGEVVELRFEALN